jgi:hypothetical protein
LQVRGWSRAITHSLGIIYGAFDIGEQVPHPGECSVITLPWVGPTRTAACPSPGLSRAPMKTLGRENGDPVYKITLFLVYKITLRLASLLPTHRRLATSQSFYARNKLR